LGYCQRIKETENAKALEDGVEGGQNLINRCEIGKRRRGEGLRGRIGKEL